MSNENIPTEDLHDQLLDRALREVVGGQSPPDLSEKIMLAVTGESDRKKVTPASAGQATLGEVSQKRQGANVQRNQRIGIAIAACVLVGSLIVFPISLATLDSPEQVQPIAKLEKTDSAAPADAGKRLNLDAYSEESDFIGIPEASGGSGPAGQEESLSGISEMARQQNTTVDLPNFELAPVTSTVQVDDDGAILRGGSKRLSEFGDTSSSSSPSTVTMGTTPHIIIQEEEEERLGFAGEGGRSAQRFRMDYSSGNDVSRYLSHTPTPGGEPKREFWGFYRTPNESPATPASPQGVPEQLALHGGFLPPGLEPGNTPALVANKQEIERQLREKMDAYHELSEEIGGSTDPTSSSKTNLLISEVRALQAQILKQKEALVNETVKFQLIREQAADPANTEKAIADALATDDVLEGYKAESFAYRQQIRALQSTAKTGTATQIQRLESSLAALEQEASEYRRTAEGEIREELKKSPNAALDMAMTEYALHRRNVESVACEAQQEYEEKLALIEQMGAKDTRLALLEDAEIDEL